MDVSFRQLGKGQETDQDQNRKWKSKNQKPHALKNIEPTPPTPTGTSQSRHLRTASLSWGPASSSINFVGREARRGEKKPWPRTTQEQTSSGQAGCWFLNPPSQQPPPQFTPSPAKPRTRTLVPRSLCDGACGTPTCTATPAVGRRRSHVRLLRTTHPHHHHNDGWDGMGPCACAHATRDAARRPSRCPRGCARWNHHYHHNTT